ncbi:MAG: cadherin-like beta sandwich domain-containing protein, partial [Spirochaetaceae bacterium]|nr:cadherin-like beta sandwich domain-containing protein [Spirochaetaceae bacterium]
LNINATAAHHNARVQVTSGGATYPANLTDAENSISKEVAAPGAGASGDITVKATAEDGITSKAYTVTIYRAEHSEGEPVFMAEGGVASIKNIGGQDYEIHTFTVDSATSLGGQTLSELEFTTLPAGGTVAVLVVAGGGAGGKSEGGISRSGGGGAGGFIYHPEYNLGNKKTFDVKVGAGGAKSSIVNIAANDTRGGNGGDSAFGTEFTAKGGGGGGNHTGYYWADGADGGSGGGSGNRQGGAAIPGTAPTGALNLGNKGGTTQTYGYSGGGGGGAKTAGKDINVVRSGGDGGAGTLSAISGTLSWYAGGGAGGAEDKYNAGEQYGAKAGNSGEAGTGDGGSGGGGVSSVDNGGNGGSGIVIVRWPVVSAD